MEFKIGYHYRISKKIGHGTFGDIYIGLDERREKNVAIKLESVTNKHLQLEYEAKTYKCFQEGIGIPRVYYFGTEDTYNIMIMELLGPSLEDLLRFCNGTFSLKTVCMLAQEMLLRIQFIHEHDYLHRDIKPENFLVGLNKMANVIHLIDFGLCKQYRFSKEHIKFREGKNLVGAPRYASLSNHLGIEQSRRDDLESLGYIFIYFLKGKLPWQGMKSNNHRRIFEKKMNISIPELCEGLPTAFEEYLNYTRSLYFAEEPDYDYLRSLFHSVMETEGFEKDRMYDWLIPSESHTLSKLPKYCIDDNGGFLHGLDKPAFRPFTEYMLLEDVEELKSISEHETSSFNTLVVEQSEQKHSTELQLAQGETNCIVCSTSDYETSY